MTFTPIIKETPDWWVGWIQEVPGVNSQGATREELVENLRSALDEALEVDREEALAAAGEGYMQAPLAV